MQTLWLGFAGLFGLILGSFLNVCIYRLPRDESIVTPRSFCPGCRRPIRWFENIPVLSFIFLRGRCRGCGHRISWRYPIVEILSGVLSIWVAIRFAAPGPYLVFYLLFSAPLLVVAFIDLEHLLIPDAITLPGILVGLASHVVLSTQAWPAAVFNSVLGILVGGGILWLLSWSYERLRGQVGLGMGDVKLAAMIGAFFGWRAIIFILLVSSVLGTLIGVVVLLAGRRRLDHPLPYGPFMALGAWIYLFSGPELIAWYLGWTRSLY